MNRFYFEEGSSPSAPPSPSSSSSSADDTDTELDTLPYPKPLPRSAFLDPTFSPTKFLSSLRNRHQTLEDLRTELRTRSQELNKELLDLVNENYQDFLSLGSSLQGGGERVEEVRVGLLGFRRDVEEVRAAVEGRRREVRALLEEKKRVRGEIQIGRALLDVDERIRGLEEGLMVGGVGDGLEGEDTKFGSESEDESEDEDEDEDEDEGEGAPKNGISTTRLKRHAHQLIYIQRLVKKIGPDHPFLIKQEERIQRLRQTILLDLSNTLKQCSATSEGQKGRTLKILGIYREMGEFGEALKVLKERKLSS